MIALRLKRWRTLGAAAVIGLAACGQPAATGEDDDNTNATISDDSGEGGEGGESGESGGEGGESGGEGGESGNSGPG
jgi:hypothetical protein